MKTTFLFLLAWLVGWGAAAQTLTDGHYMNQKNICGGPMYMHDRWTNYWEGTLRRDNPNIGTVSTQAVALMANYGITNNLNVIASAPYVWTRASAGTLAGQRGFQDLTVGLKYRLWSLRKDNYKMWLSAVGGFSLPLTNYTPDFLPLSIGLQSRTGFGRAIFFFQTKRNWSFTGQAAYHYRGNVSLDRTSYYTDRQIYASEVAIPNQLTYSVRGGYYSYRWALEATAERMDCLGGSDIRRNDMPFVANQMDATRVGLVGHYRIKALAELQVIGMYQYTVAGRNMGQAQTITLGLMKALDFGKKTSQ
jgi:Putative MetA-pathway of phenol degradation